jgi:hypothetical protein
MTILKKLQEIIKSIFMEVKLNLWTESPVNQSDKALFQNIWIL